MRSMSNLNALNFFRLFGDTVDDMLLFRQDLAFTAKSVRKRIYCK